MLEPDAEEAPAEDDDDPNKPPPWSGLKKPAGIAVNTYGMVIVSDASSVTVFSMDMLRVFLKMNNFIAKSITPNYLEPNVSNAVG